MTKIITAGVVVIAASPIGMALAGDGGAMDSGAATLIQALGRLIGKLLGV